MPTVNLTEQQVADLVRQLPPDQRREVLISLARDAELRRGDRMQKAEAALRELAGRRSMEWSTMTDEQREALVDDLIHEDRECRSLRSTPTYCCPQLDSEEIRFTASELSPRQSF